MTYSLDTITLNSKIKKIEKAIIFCHGFGGNNKMTALSLQNWAKLMPNTIIFCPQAPERNLDKKDSFKWFDQPDVSKNFITPKILHAEYLLNKYIDEVIEKNFLDEKKLILGGFSQGCMISLQVAIKSLRKINSVIGYSGKIINIDYLTNKIKSKPKIYLFHGMHDDIIDISFYFQTCKFLKKNNFILETKIFKNYKHKINQKALLEGYKIMRKSDLF